MKLACQEGLVPGKDIKEKLQKLESYGFEGVEFAGRGLAERKEEVKAALSESPIKASSICAGFRGCLLDPQKSERDLALNDIKELLKIAGEIGAVGLIMVPIFGGPRLPDLSPLTDVFSLEKDLLVKLLKEAAKTAEDSNAIILVEPLNRYETHLLRTLADGIEIVERVESPNVKIMADFFHMHIEELNIPKSIREAGKVIQHVHLADSTRMQPGTGSTDFKSGFAALKEIGFDNYMALECGIIGERDDALRKCANYLRECIGSE